MFFFFFDGINAGGSIQETNPPNDNLFEQIKHIDDDGAEFWYARELQAILQYQKWGNFIKVITKAKNACETSGNAISYHFADVGKTIAMPKGATKSIADMKLSRYACYLIAINGDPRKKVIALVQTYFTVKTRQQELAEIYKKDLKRIEAREQLKASEKKLSQNIYDRGVDNAGFGRIRSKGDSVLFGGYSTQEMKDKLGVKKNRPLADFLPAVTIAAKNLATEMTNHNVEQNDLYGELPITDEHVQNNSTIRKMLKERGIKPEALPPEPDIKKVERNLKAKQVPLPKAKDTKN